MGLFDFVRPSYHKELAQMRLGETNAKQRTAALEYATALIKRNHDIREDIGLQGGSGPLIDDDSGPLFDLIAYPTDDAIDEASFREVQRRWYKMWVQDPLAHGWIELFVQHIVGDKFQMKSRDHDEKTQEIWDKQAESMAGPMDGPYQVPPYPFSTWAQDVTRQTLTFGEDFQREFENPYDGSLLYRSMNPVWIYNPGKQWPFAVKRFTPNIYATFGIQTDPEDVYRPVTYWNDPNRTGIMQGIDAPSVIHTKIASRTMKRGRSLLLPVTKSLLQLGKILQARNDMHLLRTVVAYCDEAPEGIDPELLKQILTDNTIGPGANGSAGVNSGRQYGQEHGSTAIMGALKRTYSTPNLEAGDAYSDIKAHVYPMAIALGITFGTCWGDHADDTAASARESAFGEVLTFQSWQRWFGMNCFQRVGERRIKSAIASGQLSATSFEKFDEMSGPVEHAIRSRGQRAVPRNTKFDCEYPELRVRDVKALTDALMEQLAIGIIDKREAQVQLGYDADEMAERVMIEKLDNPDDDRSAQAELAAMGRNGASGNGGRGGNGRSDSRAIYRRQGTKS